MEINFRKYLCVDPCFFTRSNRYDKLSSTLDNLIDENSKIVIPSFLKETILVVNDELYGNQNLNEHENAREYVDYNAVKIFQELDGTFDTKNNDYSSFWKRITDFVSKFSSKIISADEVTSELLKNRLSPINLSDILKKLSVRVKKLGQTIYDFVVIGLGYGIIISYGRKLFTLMRKTGITIFEAHSLVKHKMIEEGIAPKLLKISSMVFSALAANEFSISYDLAGIPGDMFAMIPKAGLLLVGNGDSEDILDVS